MIGCSYANGDANTYTDANGHSDGNSHGRANSDTNTDANVFGNGHSPAQKYAHASTAADASSAGALIGIAKTGTRGRKLASSPLAVRGAPPLGYGEAGVE